MCFDHLHDRYGNKILVTDELPDGQMVDQWEPVSTDSLKTLLEVSFGMIINMFDTDHAPFNVISMSFFFAYTLLWTQVYEELQAEGYLVDYERVPVTDEKSPKETDFDVLVSFMLNKLVRTFLWVNFGKTPG